MDEYLSGVITSEVFHCAGLNLVADAQTLPFATASLRGIVMTDVLHHVPSARRFFWEASRVLRTGGVISMVEPWVTSWSRIVYSRLHHEPFDPNALDWELSGGGPLSGANGALPWIIFTRDRARFEREFPMLKVVQVCPTMPLRYAVSGGVTLRRLMPAWTFGAWRDFERLLQPSMQHLAMFAHITLERRPEQNGP